MDIFKTFEEYLAQSQAQIPIIGFILNLIFSGALAIILQQVYIRYGNTLSNRRLFSKTLLMIAMTTMLIITIVKSSLALSLGLVGALSIIRFRAAIKEPEELAYLFLAISIGLGFGANQGSITTVAFAIILAVIVITRKNQFNDSNYNSLHLTIMSHNPREVDLVDIIEILNKYCSRADIKRLDESDEVFEASFLVEYDGYKNLIATKKAIQKLNDKLKFTFLDNKNIF